MHATALRPRHIARAPRRAVDSSIRAEVSGPTIKTFSSGVINISSSGMLLVDAGPLQIGDVFCAKLPGSPPIFCTTVRLTKCHGAGVRFNGERA